MMRVLLLIVLSGLFSVAQAETHELTESANLSGEGADSCLTCHNDPSMQVIFRTPHGQQADPASPMAQLQCESCHGPGGDHADRRKPGPRHAEIVSFSGENGSSAAAQNQVCMDCHQNDVSLAWTGSVHERNDATCASCHTVHAKVDPVSLQAEQSNVCFDCHQQQQADSLKPSAHPIRFNQMICGDCHNPHASVSSGQLTRNTTNELCLECHQEYRGPMLFDHAPVSEDCSLCHQPHGSIHPALLTRRQPLLCQSCHSQDRHPSNPYTSSGLPNGNPSDRLLARSCMNCHTQVHGSNHPSGSKLMR